ncbi:MAG: ShlB/FhaC/HecB family hemolysin secretion/activation protein [Pasteurellaceae bacterium]|nr:ShlB/FhaC/HecB family hemolysin secretion/activation protein [Pasteurellaceae bacterium]
MELNNAFLVTLLSTSLSLSAQATLHSTSLDAGTLGRQLEQAQVLSKVKPAGELFDNNASQSPLSQSDRSALQFTLSTIQVFEFEGQEVKEDLSQILQHYINKPLTLSELKQLTHSITQYYRQNNYLVARAIIPPQEIENGRLLVLVLKGKMGEVNVHNNSLLRTSLVQRIAGTTVGDKAALYKSDLEKLALLLNDIQGVKPQLSLKAGKHQGTTDLTISLEDGQKASTYLSVDNQGNKETGIYRFAFGGRVNNLIGLGDDLKLDAMTSETAKLKSIRLDYSALVDGYGSRIGGQAQYMSYKLGGEFSTLNAKGYSHALGVYFLHPTVRLPAFRMNTKLAFTHQLLTDEQNAAKVKQKRRANSLNLLINGSWRAVENGTTYFALGANFGNVHQQSNEAAHYQDSQWKARNAFTSLTYALSHEQMLGNNLGLNLTVSGQFTDRNLDSSQKMLLGGQYAVKGYHSGVASVDEGHLFQAELKHYFPIFKDSMLTSSVSYDYAQGQFYKTPANLADSFKNRVKLQSVGVNWSLSATNNYMLNLTLAKPIGNKLPRADKHRVWFSAVKTF